MLIYTWLRPCSQVSDDTKGKAYAAWLGFYNSSSLSLGTSRLVDLANEFSSIIGE